MPSQEHKCWQLANENLNAIIFDATKYFRIEKKLGFFHMQSFFKKLIFWLNADALHASVNAPA